VGSRLVGRKPCRQERAARPLFLFTPDFSIPGGLCVAYKLKEVYMERTFNGKKYLVDQTITDLPAGTTVYLRASSEIGTLTSGKIIEEGGVKKIRYFRNGSTAAPSKITAYAWQIISRREALENIMHYYTERLIDSIDLLAQEMLKEESDATDPVSEG